jgi:hypothetical protein
LAWFRLCQRSGGKSSGLKIESSPLPKFHYHQLKDLGKSFETEEEALAFGFIAARDWIDVHKSDWEPSRFF